MPIKSEGLMAIHRFLLILSLIIFLIFPDSLSNASIVLNFRKVIRLNDAPPSKTLQNPPLPSPANGDKNLNTTLVDAGTPVKEKPKDPEVASNNKTDTTGAATASPPTSPEKKDTGKSNEGKDEVGGTKETQVVTSESCDGLPKRCEIQNTMVACILASEKGSNQLAILVQNQAEKALKVKFANPTTVDKSMQPTEVPSHQTKKIHILVAEVKGNEIVLNTGKGDCKLYTTPASGKNYFKQLSFYSKQVTPIYGVYLLLLVVLVFGGTCVCCKLRNKKRQGGGVPYQELEMGLPESAAVNVESAEGWDDNWDDNWDEDNAVKSPGGHHVGSISANGLTSRSFKKDGWEADWED